MTATGNWDIILSTPMGEQKSRLVVSETAAQMTNPDGVLEEVIDFARDGDKLSWKVQVTKPMSLKLHFNVEVDGDALTGKFRPGMFPPSAVTGTRA